MSKTKEIKTCEEASPLSLHHFIPCGKKAVALVKNNDHKAYYMCAMCADHNVNNRGAKIVEEL